MSEEYEVYLIHSGVKGMKWGVRKKQPVQTGMQKFMASPAVQLAKGTKEGNAVNLAISAASVAAVAASAPVSMPLLVGGTISARLAIKSYEAYKIFYEKHPSKILPKPSSSSMARLKVGQDARTQLTAKHGSKKMSSLKS